jgi:hypothetical protein
MNVTRCQSKISAKMEAGDLAPWIAAFSAELGTLRHSYLTFAAMTMALAISPRGSFNKIGLNEIGDQTLDQFAKHRCRCGGYRRAMRISDNYLSRIRRFIAFLVLHDKITPPSKPVAHPIEPLVLDYQQWLERHRGVCARTIARHGRMVIRQRPPMARVRHQRTLLGSFDRTQYQRHAAFQGCWATTTAVLLGQIIGYSATIFFQENRLISPNLPQRIAKSRI